MKATAKHDFVFWSFNCLSKNGRKLRKHRPVKAGQEFEVVKFFRARGGVFTAGAKCVAVTDDHRNLLSDFVEYFDYECNQVSCPISSGPLSCPVWSCSIRQQALVEEIGELS